MRLNVGGAWMELPPPPCPGLWETAGPGQLSLAAPSKGPLAASQVSRMENTRGCGVLSPRCP